MMNAHDRLSVIIPAFNAAPFISKAIESVLAQSYSNVELIVVDDASTDTSRAVAAGYGPRVRLITHEKQQGVSKARNHGVEAATGDWFAFLDADDWWPPTFVQEAMPLLKRSEALCYDSVIVQDPPPDQILPEMTLHRRATTWHHQRVDQRNLHEMFDGAPLLKSIVHREAYARVGGFDSRFRGGEDFHYHIKLVTAGIVLSLVEQPRGFYRLHPAQATAATASGNRTTIARHRQSCQEWIVMYQTLPRELALDAASVRACHESRRYWQYRLVRASILASLDRRDIRFLANGDVVRALGGAIVDVASRIAARIIRR